MNNVNSTYFMFLALKTLFLCSILQTIHNFRTFVLLRPYILKICLLDTYLNKIVSNYVQPWNKLDKIIYCLCYPLKKWERLFIVNLSWRELQY